MSTPIRETIGKSPYDGAAFVVQATRQTPSAIGALAAEILAELLDGLHHFPVEQLKKVDWSHPHFIRVPLWYQDLATFDGDLLTRLVFLAHDYCVRISLKGRINHHVIMFHPRGREGGLSQRHPTLLQAVTGFLERFQNGKGAS